MDCTKPKDTKAKCANDGGDHTANYSKCPKNPLETIETKRSCCYKHVILLSCLASLINGEGVLQGIGPRCLVVRSRLRGRIVPGSKPDSTADPLCMGPVARKIIRSDQTASRWCGAEVWRGGCQLKCRPRTAL
ncbi:hypothetical protein AVEN_84686-1 [Araneus ventricosus]|uniref:Uncharacterized protein n=1 Tax=Araneus ventricosus TaxID=182803 RepID=A0A4Y2IWJ2_ARAVE|nr:hypothetical protein AVEN_84686-1 [Araneus ventricosus]